MRKTTALFLFLTFFVGISNLAAQEDFNQQTFVEQYGEIFKLQENESLASVLGQDAREKFNVQMKSGSKAEKIWLKKTLDLKLEKFGQKTVYELFQVLNPDQDFTKLHAGKEYKKLNEAGLKVILSQMYAWLENPPASLSKDQVSVNPVDLEGMEELRNALKNAGIMVEGKESLPSLIPKLTNLLAEFKNLKTRFESYKDQEREFQDQQRQMRDLQNQVDGYEDSIHYRDVVMVILGLLTLGSLVLFGYSLYQGKKRDALIPQLSMKSEEQQTKFDKLVDMLLGLYVLNDELGRTKNPEIVAIIKQDISSKSQAMQSFVKANTKKKLRIGVQEDPNSKKSQPLDLMESPVTDLWTTLAQIQAEKEESSSTNEYLLLTPVMEESESFDYAQAA